MKKPLDILVVEDSPEFIEIAKSVYNSDDRIKPVYARTYEEALGYLGKNKFDGVITDLFFPSEIDWKSKYLNAVEENAQKVSSKREKFEKEKVAEPAEPGSNLWYNRVDDEKCIALQEKSIETYRALNENPSGLGIALYCLENNIHFVIVSQGNRHRGNLSAIRHMTYSTRPFKEISSDFVVDSFLYGAGPTSADDMESIDLDKRDPQTWKDAVFENNRAFGLFSDARKRMSEELTDNYQKLKMSNC